MLGVGVDKLRSVFGSGSATEDNPVLDEAAEAFSGESDLLQNHLMRWNMDDLPNKSSSESSLDGAGNNDYWADWSGDKFMGGYGDTPLYNIDYVTLRARSVELFTTNLYARGIVRRYLANIINTGIELEAQPDSSILGLDEDDLDKWAENIENLFSIYGLNPQLVDFKGLNTYPELQLIAKQAALIIGDVLVIQHIDPVTFLPKIELIPGNKINDSGLSSDNPETGNIVKYGVEIDDKGEHVAFWVDQADGTSKRIEARGKKTGRRVAWLIYGTDYLIDDVRGQPFLSLVLQSLKDIDRYRDSALRKALVNSFVAMFVQRDQPGIPTNPVSNMANQKVFATADTPKGPVKIKQSKLSPGMAMERLGVGEKPVMLGGQGTDEEFSDFERAIISGMSWALELPPEIVQMTFNKNYSASQAAINEYRLIVNKERLKFGFDFCQPTYVEFLVSQILAGKITAVGFLDAWRDPLQWDIFGAWVKADWFGTIKPSADILKTVKAYQALIDGYFISYAQATRELTGKKWRVVIKTLKREKIIIAEAKKEILAVDPEAGLAALGNSASGSGAAGKLLSLVSQVSEEFKSDLLEQVKDELDQTG